jgi:hypothetical protein
LIQTLKEGKFDVALTANQNYESFIATASGIPSLREGMFIPNVVMQCFGNFPDQSDWDFPLIMTKLEDIRSFKQRLLKPIMKSIIYTMEYFYYTNSMFSP